MSVDKKILLDMMVLKNAIERVHKLHKNVNGGCTHCSDFGYDDSRYPCDTVKALNGDW